MTADNPDAWDARPSNRAQDAALCCRDCGRLYSKGPDLVVSDENWQRIMPNGGGVLCPNCMNDAFDALGVPDGSIEAVFTSGPFANLHWSNRAQDAADWVPSEAIKKAFNKALDDSGCNWIPAGLKAVRPLLIEEARPEIEAAERANATRFARALMLMTFDAGGEVSIYDYQLHNLPQNMRLEVVRDDGNSRWIVRALKDSKHDLPR